MANGHGIEKLDDNSSAADLSRQVTVQMSPEQYERLFFQPTPAKGDLAKRLALTGISGSYYFFGGIAMKIAALCEFILGNTFPFALFMIYGVHWINLGYMQDPLHNIAGAYGAKGAESIGFNAGNGMYNVVMTLISFVFFLGSLRTNAPFCLAVFCLIFLFAFLAAATFATPYIATPADGEYVLLLLRIGGGFGFVTALCGWYLAICLACASTGVPCPLPAFDLSHVLFKKSDAAKLERGIEAV
ncbi:hypothetical protein LTR60_001335 [Cryomyces antarcticus]|nr:hypothetical protein LTR60_001335 [Cryomyces antarcticus]